MRILYTLTLAYRILLDIDKHQWLNLHFVVKIIIFFGISLPLIIVLLIDITKFCAFSLLSVTSYFEMTIYE